MENKYDLVLKNGYLIDGTGAEPREGAFIAISNGRITGVWSEAGSHEDIQALKIIDLEGAAVMPGLINAHAHTGFKYINGQECRDFHHDYLKKCLEEGVTTVRDEGMFDDASISDMLKKKVELENNPLYPRLIVSGKFFSAPGGYGGKAPIGISTVLEAKEKVNEVLDSGVDFIKTVLEDGMDPSTFGLPKLPDELLKAICDEAHKRGAKVSAHVTQAHNLKRLVEAGIDDAGHIVYDHLPEELIRQMVESNIHIVPTLTVHKFIQEKFGAPVLQGAMENTRGFVEAGGRIALGNDFIEEELPWYSLGAPYLEIELLQEAGLTPMQIITAATRNGAEVCKIEGEVGTIEVGKIADILIVNENPLQNLGTLKDVRMVIKGGVIVR